MIGNILSNASAQFLAFMRSQTGLMILVGLGAIGLALLYQYRKNSSQPIAHQPPSLDQLAASTPTVCLAEAIGQAENNQEISPPREQESVATLSPNDSAGPVLAKVENPAETSLADEIYDRNNQDVYLYADIEDSTADPLENRLPTQNLGESGWFMIERPSLANK